MNRTDIINWHTQHGQEEIDNAIAEWSADPVAKRASIIKDASSIYETLVLMMLATGEEAAYGAMLRREHCVYYGDPEPCQCCSDMVTRMGGTLARLVQMRIIWMGPKKRWVCECCMTEQTHVTMTPVDLQQPALRNLN